MHLRDMPKVFTVEKLFSKVLPAEGFNYTYNVITQSGNEMN